MDFLCDRCVCHDTEPHLYHLTYLITSSDHTQTSACGLGSMLYTYSELLLFLNFVRITARVQKQPHETILERGSDYRKLKRLTGSAVYTHMTGRTLSTSSDVLLTFLL